MITIISGTNRPGSKTRQIAAHYQGILNEKGIAHQLLSLEMLDAVIRNDTVRELEDVFLKPADKFIFIIPEYNGSFPGVLKLLFDITDIKSAWHYKKALLTGIADGRAGNLRGLDHLTNVLNYLKVNVYFNKLPISRINQETDEQGNWLNTVTPVVIADQVEGFLDF
ncbi:MAG: hypothetical protein BGO09_15475 [Bacteroidetes bacterium 47-18]|nr:MAG: hypothetical protein BGO09_15475 [Bacteroidetes bacterium 47-18]